MQLSTMAASVTTSGNETICAISTPHGVGGIAVVRVSGPRALQTVSKIWKGADLDKCLSHTAHLGTVNDTEGKPLDQAVATLFKAPNSYTGEDVVELSVHGSVYIQQQLVESLIAAGARLAEPGEFTRRAYLAGKLDLAQAESVADVIASDSRAAHRIAISQMRGKYSQRLNQLRGQLLDLTALLELELDFSEEDVEFADRRKLKNLAAEIYDEVQRLHDSFQAGTAIKTGIPVAIVGAVNAGKSSLLNALVGDDRAIVSDVPGTTRDTVEETIALGDYRFRFIDTAGLRHTDDTVEKIGIDRSYTALAKARIVIVVIDATTLPQNVPFNASSQTSDCQQKIFDILPADLAKALKKANLSHIIIALNKTDLLTEPQSATPTPESATEANSTECISLSAISGQGLDQLRHSLIAAATLDARGASEGLLVTNLRHAQALAAARSPLARVIKGLQDELPADLIAIDLREALRHLSSITAEIPSTEVLATIFSRFCIGK